MTDMDDATAVAVVQKVDKDGEKPVEKILTREDIFGKPWRPEIVKVPVPEWGGVVFVKELSGKERDLFEISQLEGKTGNKRINLVNMRAKLVAYSVCDEKGKRLFQEQDAVRLGDLSSKALTRVYVEASRLSGLTPEDVEDLTTALGEGQSDDSGSTSPSN